MQESFIHFDGTISVLWCRERKVGKCFCESRKDRLCFVFYDRELMNELSKSFDRAFQKEGVFCAFLIQFTNETQFFFFLRALALNKHPAGLSCICPPCPFLSGWSCPAG